MAEPAQISSYPGSNAAFGRKFGERASLVGESGRAALRRIGFFLFLSFWTVWYLLAQNVDIRVDSTLVVIPVTVTDATGRFVLGLDKKDFSLAEDGAEQTVVHFSGEDAPLSVGLLADTSGSMTGNMDIVRGAIGAF